MSEQAVEREHRVTPLELYFDLVFAFGFTQVTSLMSADPTWAGLGHGLLILAVLWWGWVSYAWLTNTVDASRDALLVAILIAMGAMFVAALAVPEAFGRHGVVFGVAFLIVAVMHLALQALAARNQPGLLDATMRLVPSSLGGAALIIVAGFVHGSAKTALWLVALVIAFGLPLFGSLDGWRIAPAYFVERHGLIVIIAIGESLIGIGIGARGTNLDAEVIVTALLGFTVASSFWLAYFDFFTIRIQQLLTERQGAARTRLARDVYSYLHLPMVGGVVLTAFALKKTLAHAGHELGTVAAFALCFGSAVYLFSFVAVRLRVSGNIRGGRTVAAFAFVAAFPVALHVPALAALAIVAAVWTTLHLYELVWWREERAEARALRA
jgi:low temperature requirement protein LtrA